MQEILKFVDSKDVRDYNKEHVFTIAEQAVLAAVSEKRTLKEKVGFLELLAKHPEEEFQQGSSMIGNYEPGKDKPFLQIVMEQIEEWGKLLSGQECKRGMCYIPILKRKNGEGGWNEQWKERFSSYREARECLIMQKQRIGCRDIFGEIYQIRKGGKSWEKEGMLTACYCLDEELRLIDAWDIAPKEKRLRDFRVYVLSPFKPGEIVKMESPFHETVYGVLPYDHREPIGRNDVTFYLRLYTYEKQENQMDFQDSGNLLRMIRCSEAELPAEQTPLRYLQSIGKEEGLW